MVENTGKTRTPAVPGVLDDPILNRGVAFSAAEREALGLTGRLPSAVLTLAEQAQRAYRQLQDQGSDLAKNVYLEQLHDRNETLYYKLLGDHLAELLPVVYDPRSGRRSRSTRTSTGGRGASTSRSTGRTTSPRRSARWSSVRTTWT
jgi:hypothetical protein